MRDVGVILAAAGAGRRFGARKQYLQILGRPLVCYSLEAFAAVADVRQVVLVVAPEDQPLGQEMVASWRAAGSQGKPPRDLLVTVTPGGARRQDSVRLGLEALEPDVRLVLVHDAARPLIQPSDIEKMIAATRQHGAAVISTPAFDSVKRVVAGEIVEELPRDQVWTVQTPQSAEVTALRRAYDAATGTEMTDEASALRAIGLRVALVEGSRENLKITKPGDEALAEAILRARESR